MFVLQLLKLLLLFNVLIVSALCCVFYETHLGLIENEKAVPWLRERLFVIFQFINILSLSLADQ